MADVSVAQESIDGPDGPLINQGDVWTTELITSLSVVMDGVISSYSAMGTTDTVSDLSDTVDTKTLQLSAASAEAESAVADYDAHVLTIQSAQSAVDDKQGEVDAAGVAVALRESDLEDAMANPDGAYRLSRIRATVVRCL